MALTLEELVYTLTLKGEATVQAGLTRVADKFSNVAVDAGVLTTEIDRLAVSFGTMKAAATGGIAFRFNVPPSTVTRLTAIIPLIDAIAVAATKAALAVEALNIQLAALKGFKSSINVNVGGSRGINGAPGFVMGPNQRLLQLEQQLALAMPGGGGGPVHPAIIADIQAQIAATKKQIASINGASGAFGRVAGAVQNFASEMFMAAIVIGFVVVAFDKILKRLSEQANEIMNVRQLSGGTTAEAAAFVIQARIAGVAPGQMYREIGRLAESGRNPRIDRALGRLGVRGVREGDVLGTWDKFLDRMSKMQNGAYKTSIAVDALGQKTATALQGLLRMSEFQRDQTKVLSAHIDPNFLNEMQKFQISAALLGETLLDRIAEPLATRVLPFLTSFVETITKAVNVISDLNDSSGGFLTDLAIAIGVVTLAIISMTAALRVAALWEAIADALAGNWGAIAAAAAIGVAGGIALWGWDKTHPANHDKEIADNTKRTADGLDKLNGHLIGGGDRSRRAATAAEAEILRHMAHQAIG